MGSRSHALFSPAMVGVSQRIAFLDVTEVVGKAGLIDVKPSVSFSKRETEGNHSEVSQSKLNCQHQT